MMRQLERVRSLQLVVVVLLAYIFYFQYTGYGGRASGNVKTGRYHVKPEGRTIIGRLKTPDISSTEGMRIAIATMNSEEALTVQQSLKNKHVYAQRHGYDLKLDIEGFSGYWHKIDMVENIISEGEYDWIWWIDFDTLITNTTVRLEDIIMEAAQRHEKPETLDMILTPDCFPLNAGSMLFRAHPRVVRFLQSVRQCGSEAELRKEHHSEQDCMRDLIADNDNGVRDRTIFVPQWRMNAFPEEIPCFDESKRAWEPGMFLVHFAGAWAHMRNVTNPKDFLFRKYNVYVE